MGYTALLVCLLPVLVMFRRQIFPVVCYLVELCFYLCAFHLVVHGTVRLARWFKLESTTYVREKIDTGWQTPLIEFWKRELYNPGWLFYFELAVAGIILYMMYRLRPFRVQKYKPRGNAPRKGLASSGVRFSAARAGRRMRAR